jgi:acetyl-CoA C-acetyltransferase
MVDPRTPVVVGVGQFTERIGDPSYLGMSAVELATAAATAALADTGADAGAVANAVDTVFRLRQFEISGPMPAALGKSNNYPRSVMRRVGGDPARVVLEPVGGQSPQKLVTETGNAIAAGDADVVMIMGSEPGSTARYFANAKGQKPDFTEHVEGQLEDRGHQIFSYIDEYTVQHGLTGAPVQYGLLENARRARLGLSVADYRRKMAELFAPFSKWLPRTPFRPRRWSDRSTRSSPSPTTTG